MIPDLGRYTVEISLAYTGSLALLAALVGWIWWRGRRIRQALAAIEARAQHKF
ncbi:MAG: heme exporter protein CcmD [Pararhodobacter sp.]